MLGHLATSPPMLAGKSADARLPREDNSVPTPSKLALQDLGNRGGSIPLEKWLPAEQRLWGGIDDFVTVFARLNRNAHVMVNALLFGPGDQQPTSFSLYDGKEMAS